METVVFDGNVLFLCHKRGVRIGVEKCLQTVQFRKRERLLFGVWNLLLCLFGIRRLFYRKGKAKPKNIRLDMPCRHKCSFF